VSCHQLEKGKGKGFGVMSVPAEEKSEGPGEGRQEKTVNFFLWSKVGKE